MILLLGMALATKASVAALGEDSGGPHLLALNPKVGPSDFATRGDLQAVLVRLLEQAQEQDLLRQRTVVVLPRHVGHWLIVANRHARVYTSRTASVAAFRAGMVTPARYLAALASTRVTEDALVRVQGDEAVGIWERICTRLADHYDVWLAGGSATNGVGEEVFGLWDPAGERVGDDTWATPAGDVRLGPVVALEHQSVTATMHGRMWDRPAGEGMAVAALGEQRLESQAQLISVWLPPPSVPRPTPDGRPLRSPPEERTGEDSPAIR